MNSENKARLLAVVAAPLFLLHVAPGNCRPLPQVTSAAPMQLEHISVTMTGKGSPVILIPGLATPRAVWDGVAPPLARTHRVYVVQVNGFGGDDPRANLQPGVLEGIVADLHGLIAREKIAGAAVVGHSMGGLVGLMLAHEHAADVGRLMVVDSLPYFGVQMAPPAIEVTTAMVEPQAKVMRDKVAAGYGKPVDAAVIDSQVKGLALKPVSVALMKPWAMKADARVTAEAMYEDLTTDLRQELQSIATPITLVYPWHNGGPGLSVTRAFYHRQFAAAPHVTFVEVADSAHFVMLDQPDVFAKALDAFLAS